MAVTDQQEFLKKKRTFSEIKTELLPAFFTGWCSQYLSTEIPQILLFLDANAGPGQEQEAPTAPLKILENIALGTNTATPLHQQVKTYFTDENKRATEALKFQVEFWLALQKSDSLPEPIILKDDEKAAFLAQLNQTSEPTLLALDPFSYPFAQDLAAQAIQQYHTDLFLLFAPAKLKAAILQEPAPAFLKQLFTTEQSLEEVRNTFKMQPSPKRAENWLITALTTAMEQAGFAVLLFKINVPGKNQAAFYVLIASKNTPVYLKAKEILYPYTDCQEDGVPLWGANLQYIPPSIPGFYKYVTKYCLENLTDELAGEKNRYHFKSIKEIYAAHSPGTPYVAENYLAVFKKLREAGHINLINAQNKQVKNISLEAVVFYKLHGSNNK